MAARWLSVLAVATLPLGGSARATDYPQDALKLILRQNAATGKEKIVWVSRNPLPVLPAAPPTSVGGAFVVSGRDEIGSTPLPAAEWRTDRAGTLHRFVNKLAPSGGSGVKMSLLKAGKILKVVAKSSVIQLDDATQGLVRVALNIGDDRYCSACTEALEDRPGVFIARGCSAPLNCHGLPALCGNGIWEVEGGEQCDGTSLGICWPLVCAPDCTCGQEMVCGVGCHDLGNPCCSPTEVCLNGPGIWGDDCQETRCSGDCGGMQCEDGWCCVPVGDPCRTDFPYCCGGAVCVGVPLIGTCCLPAGAPCTPASPCCSQSCNVTSGTCD